jgi:hypothetical protein
MISRKFFVAAAGLIVGLGLSVIPAASAEQVYLEQAISEANEAIQAGNAQEPASLIEHIDQSYDRARSAVWLNPTDHIRQGIKLLRKASKVAKGTNSPTRITKAVGFVESAKSHFEAAR